MYKILSLDGGGIRGVVTTTILERLVGAGADVVSNADLIAGTSTGGIIALGLAFGMTPAELTALYKEHGSEIFDDSWLHDITDIGGLAGSKYDNTKLGEILFKKFGHTTLGQLKKKVVIPTFNLHVTGGGAPDRWAPYFMQNLDNTDADLPVVTAALRTSAAPTYFPSVGTFVDGGVIANNPSLAAASIARRRAGVGLDRIALLSIGTGVNFTYLNGENLDMGEVHWLKPLLRILLDSPADTIDDYCEDLFGDNYRRVDPEFKVNIPLDAWKRCDEMIEVAKNADLERVTDWAKLVFSPDQPWTLPTP